MPLDLLADGEVVRVEQLAPALVAGGGRAGRRVDEVGEQHRGEHAVGLDVGGRAGHELLDLGDDRVDLPDHHDVVDAVELHQSCIGEVLGEPTRLPDVDGAIAAAVQ